MVRRAELEVLEAAVKWAERRALNLGPMSDVEQRLYSSAVMLRSARRATGNIRIPTGKKVE
jgi:hypothetical protein